MHTQPHLVLSMPPKSLTSRELAQARTVSSSRRISTSASAPSVSALVAQHRIDDDNDDEDNNVAESQAPASRNHLARLDALSARAGRPPTVNAQGKRIAPNPDAYVARHQTESNTIGKRRFGAGITLLSNQGGVNVRDFIEEQVVISPTQGQRKPQHSQTSVADLDAVGRVHQGGRGSIGRPLASCCGQDLRDRLFARTSESFF